MLRASALFLAFICALLSSLTWVKAPNLPLWRAAIAAGELGHMLLLIPLVILVTTFKGPSHVMGLWIRGATAVLCIVSILFFLRPWFSAWRIAQNLPEELRAAFGPARISHPPLSFKAAFGGDSVSQKIRSETHVFSQPPNSEPLSLDLVRPEGHSRSPCVVVFHAGGWDSGDRKQFSSFNDYLARRGYAVATVDYRLAPKFIWPAQRDDAEAALSFLAENAEKFGIDPSNFVVFGRSAGGQIAEAVGYRPQRFRIRGVVTFYAPADLYFAWRYTPEADLLDSFKLIRQYVGGPPETAAANFDSASPYLSVSRTSVPTLIAHGQLDALVWHRQSERLAAKLHENGCAEYFLDLPWATHAFDYTTVGPSGQLSTYAIEWFLQAVTCGSEAKRGGN